MERQEALGVLGLGADATPADIATTYRGLRKPILKELNRHEDGAAPPELLARLAEVEAAYKTVTQSVPAPVVSGASEEETSGDRGAAPDPGRSTGRSGFVKGDVLLDRYEIQAHIVRRPEGETYRVLDRVRGSTVALKLIAPALVADARVRARLERTLLSASYLNHPGLARVLAVPKLAGSFAVVQQIPEGSENLWDLMYGDGAKGDRLTRDVVLRLTEQAAHALGYLHTLLPHGALRPESIWLAADGSVKIADFGFHEVHCELRARRLSRSKLGTAYWAPEQYRDDAPVGAAADQYALALILYEILSGKPVVGRTEAVRSFRRDYPARFAQALERALATKPGRRFASMDAFGAAAFAGYRAERAPPATTSRESLLVPALVLFGVFAAAALSPLGRVGAEAVGRAVGRWRAVEAQERAADLELRGLDATALRLAARRDALDEASRTELDRVGARLADPSARATERGPIRDELTSIVRQLVATSRRTAEGAWATALGRLDALEGSGRTKAKAALEAAVAAGRALPTAAPAARLEAATAYVRARAAAAAIERLWRREQKQAFDDVALPGAARALLEAEAALAIGDETASEAAYGRATAALVPGSAHLEQAVARVAALDPLAQPAGIALKLDAEEARASFEAVTETAAALSDDADFVPALDALRAEEAASADARALVHDDGYWTLVVRSGARDALHAGTWTAAGEARRLMLHVVDDRLLPEPLAFAARPGAGAPGVGDVRALLVEAPRSVRASWCARRPDERPLAAPTLADTDLIVRAGERALSGTVAADEAPGVLVEGKRFPVKEGAFEARVRVAGDVLVTWLRAHAARGVGTGPAAWTRVRVDGLPPQVKVITPAEGTTLEPGTTVPLRILVYDANLTTLEVGGEAQALRRDEVYKLVDTTVRVPASGAFTLPIRAVDAAGNETKKELSWDVR